MQLLIHARYTCMVLRPEYSGMTKSTSRLYWCKYRKWDKTQEKILKWPFWTKLCLIYWFTESQIPWGRKHHNPCMRRWTGSLSVHVMACRLCGAKPLPETMLTIVKCSNGPSEFSQAKSPLVTRFQEIAKNALWSFCSTCGVNVHDISLADPRRKNNVIVTYMASPMMNFTILSAGEPTGLRGLAPWHT